MNNINDILDNRDTIIESMSYFNPLILEEHNAIVTEGILGNIAETIQKLFDIIRGWISKLIDFVASKFSSKRKKNKKSSSDDKSKTKNDSKSNDKGNNGLSDAFYDAVEKENVKKLRIMLANSLLTDVSFKQYDNMTRIAHKIKGLYDEDNKEGYDRNEENWDEAYMDKVLSMLVKDGYFSKRRIAHAKLVVKHVYSEDKSSFTKKMAKQEKKQQDVIKNHPNSKKLDEILKDDGPVKSLKTFKLPTLKDAKKAIADIKRECETALKQKDPGNYASKDEQAIRKFFVVGSEKEISYDKLIHDKIYLSYTDEGGKICVDQLRAYKKALENEYTHLHNAAVKETNQEKAQALVKKAKGINVMTQKTMGIAIKCFLHYSDVVTKAMERAKVMIQIGVM